MLGFYISDWFQREICNFTERSMVSFCIESQISTGKGITPNKDQDTQKTRVQKNQKPEEKE